MKIWIKNLPLLGPIAMSIVVKLRGIKNQIKGTKDKEILDKLDNTNFSEGAKISDALKLLKQNPQQDAQEWVKKIEKQRYNLLKQNKLLIDGTLGDGGLYDKEVTIKMACQDSKRHKSALLLYLLARSLRPQRVIELGTNVGISSSYIAAALKVNSDMGKLATLDVSPYRQKVAKQIHHNLGLNEIIYTQGLFSDTLTNALQNMAPVDLAFIDGHHQYKPTLEYFEEILEFATPNAVFIFDDINWSTEMKKAWSELQVDKRLGLVIDLSTVGICVRAQEMDSSRFVSPKIYNII
jgi:predicted O-methyltransferase YrrM